MFDENWSEALKEELKKSGGEKLKQSLNSLNINRHKFAHGIDTTVGFNNVVEYFSDSVKIIKKISNIVET